MDLLKKQTFGSFSWQLFQPSCKEFKNEIRKRVWTQPRLQSKFQQKILSSSLDTSNIPSA